jgi:hypothetical protein
VLSALKNISKDNLNVGVRMTLKKKRKENRDQIGGRLTALAIWVRRWQENKRQYS